MTRQEHLEWAKQRALDELTISNSAKAYTSFISDMVKHPELKDHSAIALGMLQLTAGFLDEPSKMKSFIEGFN